MTRLTEEYLLALASHFSNENPYFYLADVDMFYFFMKDEGIYKHQQEVYIENILFQKSGNHFLFPGAPNIQFTPNRIEQFIRSLKVKNFCESTDFFKQTKEKSNLIIFKNCILDIETFKTQNFSPNIVKINKINIEINIKNFFLFRKSKISQELRKHLSFADFKTLKEYLFFVILNKHIKKASLMLGKKNTMKTTLIEILKKFILVENKRPNDINSRFFDYLVFSKHLIVFDEINELSFQENNLEELKSRINIINSRYVEPKGKKTIEVFNYPLIIIATNKAPYFRAIHDLIDRLLIIEFKNPIKNPDVFFVEKLTKRDIELFILEILAAGYDNLRRKGIFFNEKNIDLDEKIERYRYLCDSIYAFVKDKLEVFEPNEDEESEITIANLYKVYEKYCEIYDVYLKSYSTFRKKITETLFSIFKDIPPIIESEERRQIIFKNLMVKDFTPEELRNGMISSEELRTIEEVLDNNE